MSANQSSYIRRRKLKQTLTATGAALAIITLSACGGAIESTISPGTSVSSTPAASIPAEVNGIPIRGVAQNANGKFLQTTIKADDPIFNLDMGLVSGDNVGAFSESKIKEAVRVASVFVAEEGIDSTLNGSYDEADAEAWWTANKDKFDPEWQSNFYDTVKQGGPLVVRAAWADSNPDNRRYWLDEGAPRITTRNNTIQSVTIDSQYGNVIAVDTNLDYVIWGVDEAGTKYPINVKGNFLLHMKKKDANSNEWLIQGYQTKWEGTLS